MKKISTYIALAILAAALPYYSHAQFLKNLVNNVKQSATPRSTQSSGKPKPEVSPADSTAAIKNFMTGTGGSGLLYQYHITTTFTIKQRDSTMSDTMTMAITDNHNAHVEFGMLGAKMVTLGHAGMPKYSVILYPQSKTYSLHIIDTAAINSGDGQTYKVTRIGNETVQGYSCIHSKLTMTSGRNTVITEDVWTSTAVPGYSQLAKMMTVQNVTPKMLQALEQAGCAGFFVKMDTQNKGFSMSMLLINIARKDLPASLFQIPPGYTQANNMNMLTGMMQKH